MKNIALLSALLFAFAACSPRAAKKTGKDAAKNGAGADAEAAYTPDVDAAEASIHGKEFAAAEGLEPIQFDYDSSSLSPEALAALKKNAEHLKGLKNPEVLVAGFADDRGTIEYNMALGQKRAKEVREYYIRLGVNGRAIGTISYGEEMAVCSDATEACWGRNRRAETRLRRPTAANGSTKALPQ